MSKTEERRTAANIIFYYKFSNLTTHTELDPWFADFLSSAGKQILITRIRLDNLFGRYSEVGGPTELDVREAQKGILQPMRAAHANRLDMHFIYQNAPMVLGLTLGEWEVSLSARRGDADKLRELAALFHFD